MKSVLFLQSEEPDPYSFYKEMILINSVYRDHENNITAVYSYEHCKYVLKNASFVIPPMNNSGLNEYALLIAGNLARFKNPPYHAAAKKTAIAMFNSMRTASIPDILLALLKPAYNKEINWVDGICKQLPVQAILSGLLFNINDIEFIASIMDQLVKIMQPTKFAEQVHGINNLSKEVYNVIERHIINNKFLSETIDALVADTRLKKDEIIALCVANVTGLMTQSYDACSGLLGNTLLLYFKYRGVHPGIINDKHNLQNFVTESLRYDSPVHNTKRLTTENITLGNTELKKGELVLIVIAAANWDENHFENAGAFNINRKNNTDLLSFGIGPHACLAADFATRLTTETMFHLGNQFPKTQLLSDYIEYEPIINCRIPKKIIISLT